MSSFPISRQSALDLILHTLVLSSEHMEFLKRAFSNRTISNRWEIFFLVMQAVSGSRDDIRWFFRDEIYIPSSFKTRADSY